MRALSPIHVGIGKLSEFLRLKEFNPPRGAREASMYMDFVCVVSCVTEDLSLSYTYGVSAGNPHEVRESIARKFADDKVELYSIENIRFATRNEKESLELANGKS